MKENTGTKKKKMTQKQKIDLIFIWSMLAIPILYWLIFYLYKNFDAMILAFRKLDGTWTMDMVKSAIQALTMADSGLSIALRNTFIYFIKDLLMIPFHLMIAYFLYKQITGAKFFRIMFYLPALINDVVTVTVYSSLIAPYGVIGQLIEQIFGTCPQFLADSSYATSAILFYTIWQGWGGNMLILGGSLARIPKEIFEAARLDGITPWEELKSIILPLMWPTLSTILVLNLTGLFNAGGPILLFDSSKMDVKIDTLYFWMYEKVWKYGSAAYNETSAIGFVLTVIGAPIIMFLRWIIDRIPKVEY